MSILEEIEIKKDDKGVVGFYAPRKYYMIEGIFDNLGEFHAIWEDAIAAIENNTPWEVHGDEHSVVFKGEEVIFSSQFRNDETVRLPKTEAKELFEKYLSLSKD
ncbi:MAG TPA: hypothetical protein VD907_06395 [Verrucomicrobiae bacterium]|nr:hypothetical protein [Verrucomicrobiae bacterium]